MSPSTKHSHLCLILLLPILAACNTYFPEPEFAPLIEPPQTQNLFDDFKTKFPNKLSMEQSALISIGHKKITAIGICKFDTQKDEIALMLVTTTGMKILELSRSKNRTVTHFALPEITNKVHASKQLIADIHNIYFQPVKATDDININGNKITYTWKTEKGCEQLVFGRLPKQNKVALQIKRVFYKGTLDSVVYYSDYQRKNGKTIPMTIHYENRKYDYSLILKTKKLYYDN